MTTPTSVKRAQNAHLQALVSLQCAVAAFFCGLLRFAFCLRLLLLQSTSHGVDGLLMHVKESGTLLETQRAEIAEVKQCLSASIHG